MQESLLHAFKYIKHAMEANATRLLSILLGLCALSVSCLQAFSQRQPYAYQVEVNYKMTYQPDSTNPKGIQQEYMTLLVGAKQSVFCAKQFLVMDSAITAELSKGNSLGPSMGFFLANGTHHSQVVFKEATKLITFEKASRFITPAVVYRYEEPRAQFSWEISADTTSIGGIVCQKATTRFGNRKWVAWFAPSIPISDGPYKFHGLPGLILKLSDEQNYWNFDLASIKNINKSLSISFLNKTPQPLKSKEEFLAKKKYMRDNRFQLMQLSGDRFSNPAAFMREFEEKARQDNNWIELYKGD